MQTSLKGLIDIVSHEGVCLEWYYDSVGVPTIGIGQTAYDGFDPRTCGALTVKQAFELFRERLKTYEAGVDRLGRDLSQTQYDALVSLCYNFGESNLKKLCRPDRDLREIGEAIMLYLKPPEIRGRREREQALFKYGTYSNKDGRVRIIPVVNHRPQYHKGYLVDVLPLLAETPATPAPAPVVPPAVLVPEQTKPEPVKEPWSLKTLFKEWF